MKVLLLAFAVLLFSCKKEQQEIPPKEVPVEEVKGPPGTFMASEAKDMLVYGYHNPYSLPNFVFAEIHNLSNVIKTVHITCYTSIGLTPINTGVPVSEAVILVPPGEFKPSNITHLWIACKTNTSGWAVSFKWEGANDSTRIYK